MSCPAPEVSGTPHPTLMPLIIGFMPARVIHVAAELGLADRLADGPKDVEVLASETDAHEPSLHRLLRALASLGVVDEHESGRFALTPLGEQLRTGVPGSQRNLAMMFGGERAWRCWGELLHSVRTGESAMHHLYGMGSFEFLATLPRQAAIFNEAMAEITRETARAVVAAYDFSPFRELSMWAAAMARCSQPSSRVRQGSTALSSTCPAGMPRRHARWLPRGPRTEPGRSRVISFSSSREEPMLTSSKAFFTTGTTTGASQFFGIAVTPSR